MPTHLECLKNYWKEVEAAREGDEDIILRGTQSSLDLAEVVAIARYSVSASIDESDDLHEEINKGIEVLNRRLENGENVYGWFNIILCIYVWLLIFAKLKQVSTLDVERMPTQEHLIFIFSSMHSCNITTLDFYPSLRYPAVSGMAFMGQVTPFPMTLFEQLCCCDVIHFFVVSQQLDSTLSS